MAELVGLLMLLLGARILLQDPALEDSVTSKEVALHVRVQAAQLLTQVGTQEQRLQTGDALLAEANDALHGCGLEMLTSVGSAAEPALLAVVPFSSGERFGKLLLALAQVGSTAAVPVLRARQSELALGHGGLSHAVDHAIATLQQGVQQTRGAVALAGPAEAHGALAVVASAGGGVSLA